MAISILNNIPALAAENQLSITQTNLNQTLQQLASGSRINTGATMRPAWPSQMDYKLTLRP